jgi:fatty-acyl-CoA synthase
MSDGIYSIDWIAQHASRSPERIACVDLASRRTLTYGILNERISRLSHALREFYGLSAGNRVSVLSRNDTDVFELQFACHRANAIFVPLNWRLSAAELEAIAQDAAPSMIFYASEFRSSAECVASAAGATKSVEMKSGAASEYERALAQASARYMEMSHTKDDIWALLYTSGTTGKPKGAQVTFGMALCNAVVLGQQFRISEESRNLVTLPTFHTAGLNVFANPVFFSGGTNLVAREFEPDEIVELLRGPENTVTHLMGVPTTHSMLINTSGFDEIGSKLQEVCVAGAPCPSSTVDSYAALGVSLRQCWGMTEVGPLALLMPRSPPSGKRSACGLPSIFAKCIVGDAKGIELPSGEIGELLVKGPIVTSGYWRRPEANLAAFNSEGWFRTGDAVRRDEEGFFYIVDRWKDMYISGGENIYPAEVEGTLSLLQGVSECAVIGVPDAKWGEVGCAFIVRRTGSQLDELAIRSHCERRLARYKIPKEIVFVGELPRNASGKVLRSQLKGSRARSLGE